MNISHLIEVYGYLAVFILVGASPWVIFGVAVAGAIVGDNIGFWIGHRFGYSLARKYGRHIWLDERKLKIGRYIFDAHGQKVVFFGRFVSILHERAVARPCSPRQSLSSEHE